MNKKKEEKDLPCNCREVWHGKTLVTIVCENCKKNGK